jgi:hypothetical protein
LTAFNLFARPAMMASAIELRISPQNFIDFQFGRRVDDQGAS